MRRTYFLVVVPFLLCSSLSVAQSAPPASRPAVELAPELREALQGLDKHISPEARANPRAANQTERKLAQLMTILLMSERPENAAAGQKNAENIAVADKAVKEQYAKMRADPANASPEIQEQLNLLEKLSLESIHLLDFLTRPQSFATTRESQLDLAERLEQIPGKIAREAELNRDLAHQEKRLALMRQVRAMEQAGDQPEKLAATKELLSAMDALAAAQSKLDTYNASTRPAE